MGSGAVHGGLGSVGRQTTALKHPTSGNARTEIETIVDLASAMATSSAKTGQASPTLRHRDPSAHTYRITSRASPSRKNTRHLMLLIDAAQEPLKRSFKHPTLPPSLQPLH